MQTFFRPPPRALAAFIVAVFSVVIFVRGTAAQQESFSPTWTKFCPRNEQSGIKAVCLTSMEMELKNGRVVRASVIDQEGEQRKILRVTIPREIHPSLGARATIDQGRSFGAGSLRCLSNGCLADFPLGSEILARLKSGRMLIFQSVNASGQAIRYSFPLAGFSGAHEGVASNEKVLEEQKKKKKLEEELQRRAEDLRKNLQNKPGNLQNELEKRAVRMRMNLHNRPAEMPDKVE